MTEGEMNWRVELEKLTLKAKQVKTDYRNEVEGVTYEDMQEAVKAILRMRMRYERETGKKPITKMSKQSILAMMNQL